MNNYRLAPQNYVNNPWLMQFFNNVEIPTSDHDCKKLHGLINNYGMRLTKEKSNNQNLLSMQMVHRYDEN